MVPRTEEAHISVIASLFLLSDAHHDHALLLDFYRQMRRGYRHLAEVVFYFFDRLTDDDLGLSSSDPHAPNHWLHEFNVPFSKISLYEI